MTKNILITNSSPGKNQPLVNLLEELSDKGYSFYLASMPSDLLEQFKKNKWLAQKIYFGPKLNKKFNQLLFISLLPFLYLAFLARLTYYKFNKKINSVICLNINEKIIFTPITKWLKIKIIWLEDADSAPLKDGAVNKFLLLAYKWYSNRANIVTFSDFTRAKLKNLGIKEKNIKIIRPGIKLKIYSRQDNLFNELANTEGKNYRRKFFTIGTVAELNKKQNIEILFQAAKICLNVIPGMQLIIVGEGEERKSLAWLAKKMEIDNMVWFVGEQSHLKKWLDSFDVFTVSSELPRWNDFNITLQAMAAGLPIIGLENFGVEEIVNTATADIPPRRNGQRYTPTADRETLAEQIIKLYKDKNLRLKLGQKNKEEVEKYFTLDRMVEEFEKILT
jgi:glycosyltransferase involved in cell wall biosynthesis